MNQQGGYIPTAFVQRCFNNGSFGHSLGIGFEVQQFRFQQDFVQQFLNIQTGFCGDVLGLDFSAPIFHQQVHAGQLFFDLFGIRFCPVHLVDGKHNGDTGCLRVADGFLGLGHDRVVRRHNNNGNVGHLGTAGTHGGKRFVARCIQEGDLLTSGQLHTVSTNVLRDAPGLTGDDIGLPDVVQKRGFTVVDVSHDRNNRGTGRQIFFGIGCFQQGLVDFFVHKEDGETEFIRYDGERLLVQTLVHGDHDAQGQTDGDNGRYRHRHHVGQFGYRHKLGNLQYFVFGRTQLQLVHDLIPTVRTLVSADFGALGLASSGELLQRFADLLLDLLVGQRGLRRCGLLVLASRTLALSALLSTYGGRTGCRTAGS